MGPSDWSGDHVFNGASEEMDVNKERMDRSIKMWSFLKFVVIKLTEKDRETKESV